MKITRQTCNRIQIIWTRIIFAQGENRIFPFPRKIIKKNFNNKPKQEKLSNTKPFRNARRSLYISSSISISLLSSITETSHFLFSFFSILEPRISNRGKIFRSFFSFNKKKKNKKQTSDKETYFFFLFFFKKNAWIYTRLDERTRRDTLVYLDCWSPICIYPWNPLTFDVHGDPLADCWRDSIGRDAEIRAHFIARDPRQV